MNHCTLGVPSVHFPDSCLANSQSGDDVDVLGDILAGDRADWDLKLHN